jgi:K(+)-stimulated pyrophosphate-energized sodium pump
MIRVRTVARPSSSAAMSRCLVVLLLVSLAVVATIDLTAVPALAQIAAPAGAPSHPTGGEASLKMPDLDQVDFSGVGGRTLLVIGLGVCVLGLIFGLVIFSQLKNLPVHAAMREISELIYETCKTYLITQGKFILVL